MALSKSHTFVAILLLLLPIAAKGDDHIPPSFSPFFEDLCKEVECGRGTCQAAAGYPFNFKCKCDAGWKRTRLDDEDEENLEYLPCIIPNSCYWVYCGEGTCTKNTTYTKRHTCQCNPGYSNLLNISVFPCYSDCATGSESCERLGIRVASSTSNNTSTNDNNKEDLCKEVECGRGTCEAASSSPYNFKCKCDDGWKRTRLEDEDEENLDFLPCIVPNCTVDYSCMPAAPPAPSVPHNLSAFDPCYWVYCGEGTCTKNTTYTKRHTCQCNPGYSNLLNISAFPCYSDCATGSESCERLGIRVASSTSNNPSSNDNNKAIAFSLGTFNLMAVLLGTATVVFIK